jgi:hypothetical protein
MAVFYIAAGWLCAHANIFAKALITVDCSSKVLKAHAVK